MVGWWSQNCFCGPWNILLARRELSGFKKKTKKKNFPGKLHQHRADCKVNCLGMGGIVCLGRGVFLFLFCFILFCPFVNM